MKIELALFASLTVFYPEGGERGARTLDVSEGTTIADVIDSLGLPEQPRVVFVNNLHAEETAGLHEGDRLAIFPPVAGG